MLTGSPSMQDLCYICALRLPLAAQFRLSAGSHMATRYHMCLCYCTWSGVSV